MTSPTMLIAGRVAAEERRWGESFECLAIADSSGLPGADLDLFAMVAFLRGELETAVDARSRAYEAHLLAGDTASAVISASWLAFELLERGDYSRMVAWAARAMQVAEAVTEPRAVVAMAHLAPAIGQLAVGEASALRQFEEIHAIAADVDDRELAVLSALGLGKSLLASGAIEQGLQAFDGAVGRLLDAEGADAGTAVSAEAAGIVLSSIVHDAASAFDMARWMEWSRLLDVWCAAQPQLIVFSGNRHALRAFTMLFHGDWSSASAAVELAMTGLQAGDYRAAWSAPYHLGELQRLRGAFHSSEEAYRRAGASGWDPQPGLALLHLAAGKVQRAQEEIRRAVAGSDAFTRRSLLPAVVEIEVAAGDLDAALRAREALLAKRDEFVTPWADAEVAAAEARVLLARGDPDAARDAARRGESAYREIGAIYEGARLRVLIGRSMMLGGEKDAARAELRRARDVFQSLGAAPAVAEVTALLGEARPGALTPRELEVIRLVSTGQTNRLIADRLALSEKTVARHLSNIYGKLGISSRAAATAYAYENGLV